MKIRLNVTKLDAKAPPAAGTDGLRNVAGYVSIVPPLPPKANRATAVWTAATPFLSLAALKVSFLVFASRASTVAGVAAAPVDIACRLGAARSKSR